MAVMTADHRVGQFLQTGRMQKAHQFVLGVYALTAAFPKQETYAEPRDSAAAEKRTGHDS
jgi:hypothetical protein